MINKIVVLAAGKGTRMLELSADKPKHLINVGDKPFLYYHFNNLKKAGFQEIIVVIGYKKEKMAEFARYYGQEFNLRLVDQFAEVGEEKYGTAMPVLAVEKIVRQENFVVVNGDDLFSVNDLKRFKKLDDNLCYVGGIKNEKPEFFGLLIGDECDFLSVVKEKPRPNVDFDASRPLDYLVNCGLYKFTAKIFDKLRLVEKSERGEYELPEAISLLAKEKKVKILPIRDYWLTFSRPEDIQKMKEFLLKK